MQKKQNYDFDDTPPLRRPSIWSLARTKQIIPFYLYLSAGLSVRIFLEVNIFMRSLLGNIHVYTSLGLQIYLWKQQPMAQK